MTKTCSKCGVVKALGEFGRDRAKRDGLHPACLRCRAEYRTANRAVIKTRNAAYRTANHEKVVAREAAYKAENADAVRARKAKYRLDNLDRVKAALRAWTVANPDKVAAHHARRRAAKLRATPAWANLGLVAAYYTMAAWVTQATGVPHHVDHIVPLKGKHASGLHNEFNLQVLPAKVNLSKGNRPSDVAGLR